MGRPAVAWNAAQVPAYRRLKTTRKIEVGTCRVGDSDDDDLHTDSKPDEDDEDEE